MIEPSFTSVKPVADYSGFRLLLFHSSRHSENTTTRKYRFKGFSKHPKLEIFHRPVSFPLARALYDVPGHSPNPKTKPSCPSIAFYRFTRQNGCRDSHSLRKGIKSVSENHILEFRTGH